MALLWPNRAIGTPTEPWHSVPAMPERSFVVLRYVGKVPAMASCTKCQRKFFTPATHARDPVGADEYLRRKFDVHECPGEQKTARAW
jgi:hypothetical protein